MAIKHVDFRMIQECLQGKAVKECAILGDCNIDGGYDSFKSALGLNTLDTFDIEGTPTYKVDLNESLEYPVDFSKQYDLIIDSGTLYCCFDIAQAWKNCLNLLKDAGTIIHTSNLAGFFGRGFYSFSPALFFDFYTQNGFTIEKMGWKINRQNVWNFFDPKCTYIENGGPNHISFQEDTANMTVQAVPNDILIMCCATRTERKPFTKPIPSHFIKTNGR